MAHGDEYQEIEKGASYGFMKNTSQTSIQLENYNSSISKASNYAFQDNKLLKT